MTVKRGLTLSGSTSTNTRVSRLLHRKSKARDASYLNPQETYGFPSISFKSESNLNTPERRPSDEKKQKGSNETKMLIKVNTILFGKEFICVFSISSMTYLMALMTNMLCFMY